MYKLLELHVLTKYFINLYINKRYHVFVYIDDLMCILVHDCSINKRTHTGEFDQVQKEHTLVVTLKYSMVKQFRKK